MAADTKSYPPSQRRLARLWALGVTPASGALVAAATLAAGAACCAIGWPWFVGWTETAITGALRAATQIETDGDALALARGMFIGAGVIVGLLGAVVTIVAIAAHRVQLADRGDASAGAPAADSAAQSAASGIQGGWLTLGAAVALAVTVLAARTALAHAGALAGSDEPAAMLAAWTATAAAVAWPLVAALVGFGLLDMMMRRAAFTGAAWLSRREMEEELRLVQGPDVLRTWRQRRMRRGERDA